MAGPNVVRMPQPPQVCSQCGAPMENRPDWVAPMCPRCAESSDATMPPASPWWHLKSPWWILASVVAPGLINLLLASLQLGAYVIAVAFGGAIIAGMFGASIFTRRPSISAPLRFLLGLICFGVFAVAAFMSAFFGCAMGSKGSFLG